MNLALVKEKISSKFPGKDRTDADLTTISPLEKIKALKNLGFSVPKSVYRICRFISAFLKAVFFFFRITFGSILYYLRHHPLHAIFNLCVFSAVASLVMTGAELHQQVILSRISNDTISSIIAGSDYTRQYDIDGMRRNGVREFVAAGAPKWAQSEGVRAILFEARKAQLPIEDQAVLLAIANIESGFNPAAQAGITTACGLFQFVQRTGEMFNLSAKDCMDPWLNARAGIRHYLSNYEKRVKARVDGLEGVERVFRTFELSYYLHHDGPASSNPSNDLKAVVLTGTQFLFKAYHILQQEAELQRHAPSFGQTFFESTVSALYAVKESFSMSTAPSGQRISLLKDNSNNLSVQ